MDLNDLKQLRIRARPRTYVLTYAEWMAARDAIYRIMKPGRREPHDDFLMDLDEVLYRKYKAQEKRKKAAKKAAKSKP